MSVGRSPQVPEFGGPTAAPAIKALRGRPTTGLSRRTLLRRSLGLGVALAAAEGLLGMVSFVWPKTTRASARVRVGSLGDLIARNGSLPIVDGFPAYVADAHAFVMTIDPAKGGWLAGADPTGDGRTLNVRALSQRCPHLGCRPNPCVEDFWFRCPCHQSRYDRLGTKADGVLYGPAPHGMDRFPIEVDGAGVLTVDTSRVVLGPLPVVLGQPGLIPPRVPNGCVG
ncbi:MAG: Rieske 2Fe-2S domain-containing protein [Chloroflexi bacterium]|nr:MAG: Rieske 2Fe-2S domain-containing protein [Chloroflexota bacterium]